MDFVRYWLPVGLDVCIIDGTWYLVRGTWYLVPGTRYLVAGGRFVDTVPPIGPGVPVPGTGSTEKGRVVGTVRRWYVEWRLLVL